MSRVTTKDRQPTVAMIMAMDRNRLIGRDGGIPWHVPGELAYFKSVTMGKPVIMGRKTFESIGRPLPGRTNIVVTRNPRWSGAGVQVASDLDQALISAARSENHPDNPELMIIGGAALCEAAMPRTQRLYLTTIDDTFKGDTWLGSFRWEEWQVQSRAVQDPAAMGGWPVTYWVLEKPSGAP